MSGRPGLGAARWAACAIAMAAVVDPPMRASRAAPLPIALRSATGLLTAGGSGPAARGAAQAIRERLEAELPGALAINTAVEPRATIVAGGSPAPALVPDQGAVSFVLPQPEAGPRVQVLSISSPRPVLPGWAGVVRAEIAGHAVVPGSSAAIVLESHGVEVDRVEHRWAASDERFTAPLSFVPPVAGSFALTVRAVPPAGAAAAAGLATPVRVVAEARRLHVLAFDPRPSWASAFARRVLEADSDFDVAARVRASRGLEVRTGEVPLRLSETALEPFDLVLVGAPEELTAGEVEALQAFAERRGGTVVLMADRKPSGVYTHWFGPGGFDEALLDKPIRVTALDGTGLRGSEFAFPRSLPAGAESLVALPGTGSRPAVVSMPFGAGRIVFSGLLDAWRYRGDDDEAFASFWRTQLGREAARAPRRIELTLDPGIATAGSRVRLRVAVRATEHERSGTVVTIPAVAGRAVDERGREERIRLWPTAEAGVFEGWFEAVRAGRYDIRVQTDVGVSADSLFVVLEAGGAPPAEDDGSARAIARATGGVAVTADNLQPLVAHLRALPRERVVVTSHPMRSWWWAFAFVALLSIEWASRRRRGLR